LKEERLKKAKEKVVAREYSSSRTHCMVDHGSLQYRCGAPLDPVSRQTQRSDNAMKICGVHERGRLRTAAICNPNSDAAEMDISKVMLNICRKRCEIRGGSSDERILPLSFLHLLSQGKRSHVSPNFLNVS
jgi:hypothetical protein